MLCAVIALREAAIGVRLDDGGVDITLAANRPGIAELPRDVIDRLRQALFSEPAQRLGREHRAGPGAEVLAGDFLAGADPAPSM
jgi:hypothetical protein